MKRYFNVAAIYIDKGKLIIDATEWCMDNKHYDVEVEGNEMGEVAVTGQRPKYKFSMTWGVFDTSLIMRNSIVLKRTPYPWSKKKEVSKDGFVETIETEKKRYTATNYCLIDSGN